MILQALKTYGMIVADNGSSWYISGAADKRWNDDDLNQLKTVPGAAFEAVDTGRDPPLAGIAVLLGGSALRRRAGTSTGPQSATPCRRFFERIVGTVTTHVAVTSTSGSRHCVRIRLTLR